MAWMKSSIIFSCNISHAEFLNFINPLNPVGQVLLSHLVAVQTLVPPGNSKRLDRKARGFLRASVRWLDLLHANIKPNMKSYYEWPIKRTEELRGWLKLQRADLGTGTDIPLGIRAMSPLDTIPRFLAG